VLHRYTCFKLIDLFSYLLSHDGIRFIFRSIANAAEPDVDGIHQVKKLVVD